MFLFLFGVFALLAGGHSYSSDEEGYFQQARALLRGTYAFTLTPDNNLVTAARGGRNGATTGGGGIGESVAALPLLAVGTAVAALLPDEETGVIERLFVGFTNSWITALIGVVLFLAAMELGAPRRSAVLLALVYGLGTMALPHAKTLLFSEPLAALGTLAAVYFAMRAVSRASWPNAALAGVCAGVATLARPSAAPFAVVVGLYIVVWGVRTLGARRALPQIVAFAGASALMTGVVAGVNWWRWGAATDAGYSSVPFDFSPIEGAYGLLLSPGKSLFLYAPVALVAVFVSVAAFRRRPAETLLIGAIVLGNLLIFARFFQWHGDQAWGPRYLQITLPVLLLLIAPVLTSPKVRRAVLVCGLVGAFVSWGGAMLYFNQFHAIAGQRLGTQLEDGEPAYWKEVHFDPRWSPVVWNVKLVDDLISGSAHRIDAVDGTFARYGAFPTTTNARYGWYFQPPQVDAWWYWVFPQRTSKVVLLLLPGFLACACIGFVRLRRSVSAS